MNSGAPQAVLEAHGISKSYGYVDALKDISIQLIRGEVLAIFGDNGAGKSTMLKILCGVVSPDAGQLVVDGEKVGFGSVRDAQAHGIDAVYQDLALAPHLTVLENIFLGHERLKSGWRTRLGWLDRRAMGTDAAAALKMLGISLPNVELPVTTLSGGQAQAVAIARATMWAKNCVLLDEPTAALGVRQSMIVDKLIRSTADRGLGVLVISHDIPRILKVADRVVILRHGEIVLTDDARNLDVTKVVSAIVGEIAN